MIDKKFVLCFGKEQLSEYEVTRGKRFLDGAFGVGPLSVASIMPYYDVQRDSDMDPSKLAEIPEHYAVQVKGTSSESSVVTTSNFKKFMKLGLYDTLRAKKKIRSFVIVSNGIVSILPPQKVQKQITVLDGSAWYDIFSKLEKNSVDVIQLLRERFLYDHCFAVSVVNPEIVATPIEECKQGNISLPLELSLEHLRTYNALSTDEREVIRDVAERAVQTCLDRLTSFESTTSEQKKRKLVLGFDASKKTCKK